MELKVGMPGLNACAKQLSVCEKLLSRREKEVLEIMEKLRRIESPEVARILNGRLKQYSETIQLQCRQIGELQKVLERAGHIYQKCEDEILSINEAKTCAYEEKTRMVHLEKMREFQIVLK